jgi:hypothetical protein
MTEHHETDYKTVDVSHEEFRKGIQIGRYRVIVNPALAPKYVQHRLMMKILILPVLGIGIAVGLSGYVWVGLFLVVVGILVPRLIRKKAPELLLHLAMQNQDVYREAIEYEVLEVRDRVPV